MQLTVTTISNEGHEESVFSSRAFDLHGERIRMLSEQQACENFRLRHSDADFSSGFHVAGDPTLLVVLAGTVRIELCNGSYKDFSAGQMFIAEDYLLPTVPFDNSVHGHRAEVVGDVALQVLHLKLEKRF